ncbi:hypothetical protein KCV07_g342, partial [Aureobasidium melanogenum]
MSREQAVEGQDTFACRFTYALLPDRLAPGHSLKCNTHINYLFLYYCGQRRNPLYVRSGLILGFCSSLVTAPLLFNRCSSGEGGVVVMV